jgi:cytochrome P450
MADFAFNPFDEATRRDPFALYARARREHPVWVHPDFPVVSVFRHADVQAILKDHATWSSDFEFDFDVEVPPSMIATDPPVHTRLRGLVIQAFTPRRVRELKPRITAIAHELLDAALAEGRVDLVQALTYPLPVIVIAELIGIPVADRALLKGWSDQLVANLGLVLLVPPTPERIERQKRLLNEMHAYFTRLVDQRRADPRDDLLTGLIQAEHEGSRLSFDEMLQMLSLLLVAGNETTTTLIGNTVLTLLAHPDALDAVRKDPGLVPGTIEEVLRFVSPVQLDPRRATRPVEVGGVTVAQDQIVLTWIGSANRDEAVFDHPDAFDPTRTDNRHLAFGFGPHFCLGASLATLEAQVALQVLLERTRDFRLVEEGPLPIHPSIVFRGVTRLPLVLTRRATMSRAGTDS